MPGQARHFSLQELEEPNAGADDTFVHETTPCGDRSRLLHTIENRRVHPGDFHPPSFSSVGLRCDSSAAIAAVSSQSLEARLPLPSKFCVKCLPASQRPRAKHDCV